MRSTAVVAVTMLNAALGFASVTSHAADKIIPDGQLYSVRPSIHTVAAVAHADLPNPWESLKAGKLAFVAQLLEVYPDRELYFLARDAEYIYDMAWLLTAGTADQNRLHLLNVSRTNKHAPGITKYLAQNGIDDQMLADKKIVFVDTGFAGSIPITLQERMKSQVRGNMGVHLIVSETTRFPSSRVFLTHLHPHAYRSNPATLHATIVSYEHMHHYTYRADGFMVMPDRVEAISRNLETDGKISHVLAREYMEDLKAYASREDIVAHFAKLRERWRAWYTARADSAELKNLFEDFLKPDEPFAPLGERRAMVVDFVELAATEGVAKGWADVASLRPLLNWETDDDDRGERSFAENMALDFPHWAQYFADPPTGLPELVDEVSDDWSQIFSFMDVVKHSEWQAILMTALHGYIDDPQKVALLKGLQAKGSWEVALAYYYYGESKDLSQEAALPHFVAQLLASEPSEDDSLLRAFGDGYQQSLPLRRAIAQRLTDYAREMREDERKSSNWLVWSSAELEFIAAHGVDFPRETMQVAFETVRYMHRNRDWARFDAESFLNYFVPVLPRSAEADALIWLVFESAMDFQVPFAKAGFNNFPWRSDWVRASSGPGLAPLGIIFPFIDPDISIYTAEDMRIYEMRRWQHASVYVPLVSAGKLELQSERIKRIRERIDFLLPTLRAWQKQFRRGDYFGLLRDHMEAEKSFVANLRSLAAAADHKTVANFNAGLNPFFEAGAPSAEPFKHSFALVEQLSSDSNRGYELARVTRETDGELFERLLPTLPQSRDLLAHQVSYSVQLQQAGLAPVMYEGPFDDGSVVRRPNSAPSLASLIAARKLMNDEHALQALREFIFASSRAKIFIPGVRPEDLIFAGGVWRSQFANSVLSRPTKGQVVVDYAENWNARWIPDLPAGDRAPFQEFLKQAACVSVFGVPALEF